MPKLKSLRYMSIKSITTSLKNEKETRQQPNHNNIEDENLVNCDNNTKKRSLGKEKNPKIKNDNDKKKKQKPNPCDDNNNSGEKTAQISQGLLSALNHLKTNSKSHMNTIKISDQKNMLKSRDKQPIIESRINDNTKQKLSDRQSFSPYVESNDSNNVYTNKRTIYIEGLPFTSNEDEVRLFFQDICSKCSGNIKAIRLPTWHDSGRLKGYGHVEFSNEKCATQSFELDGCDFLNTGRFIKIAFPKIPRSLTVSSSGANSTELDKGDSNTRYSPSDILGCRTVFLKNLPYDVSEKEINETIQVCGKIDSIRLAAWNHTGSQKGFGYVEFKKAESATIAVKKSNKLMIRNRPIFIDFETHKPKLSYKPLKNKTSN